MQRHTINDIARRAQVSKSSVSLALNGRPGVASATRSRILAVAEELGWRPNSAARALSSTRANVIGFAPARKPSLLTAESYFVRLIAGMQSELTHQGTGLLLQMVGEDPQRELDAYRRWWLQRQVDGVVLADLRVDDLRVDLLAKLGLPAVMLGRIAGAPLPAVWADPQPAMQAAVSHLAELGHRRIARVRGIDEMMHTRERDAAYAQAVEESGVKPVGSIETDYSGAQGAEATRTLLARPDRPTAIIYDNDVMAVSAIGVAHALGIAVPAELSIIAWDDSPLCELPYPQLTAVHTDIEGLGAAAVRALRQATAGEEVADVRIDCWSLVERQSTARPPALDRA